MVDMLCECFKSTELPGGSFIRENLLNVKYRILDNSPLNTLPGGEQKGWVTSIKDQTSGI